MRESTIENYLVRQCKKYGAVAEKFISPGKKGVPDRIVSWPFGYKDWVECKAPDGQLKAHQKRDHADRRSMGHEVIVVYNKKQVDDYIDESLKRHNACLW